MIFPDAVHHHARGERIVRIGDPAGELRARVARIGREFRRALWQQARRAAACPRCRLCSDSRRAPADESGVTCAGSSCTLKRAGSGAGILSCSSSSCCSRASFWSMAAVPASWRLIFFISASIGSALAFHAACSSAVARGHIVRRGWRRRRPACGSSRSGGWGRTCGRGSGRSRA